MLVISLSQTAFANNCSTHTLSSPEKATVKWVYDGDTLLLTDKRKVRIIGIDTPEVKHHQQKAQPYGAKATEALRELLKKHEYKVVLRFGKEEKDRYSRLLAHVFTPGGTNLSTWLLEEGYARTLNIAPNVQLADCYRKAEQYAQKNTLKIWQQKSHQIKQAESLKARTKGYIRLKGKVKKIKHHKKSLAMELDSNFKHPIKIKVMKRNFPYFKNINFDKLWDQTIIVSGTLRNRKGRRSITLNHSAQMTVIQKERITPTIEWSSKNEN